MARVGIYIAALQASRILANLVTRDTAIGAVNVEQTGASHAVTERRTRTLRDRVHTFYEAGIGTHASGQLDTYG